jgi:phospholipid/cholesterol/gamma-HCH transport system substrate-binding protein
MTTNTRGQAIRVGVFLAVALGLFMTGLMLIGEGENWLERKVRYAIHFPRTTGLMVGAPVALVGVNVGSVVDIDFPSDPAMDFIRVVIEVKRTVADRIREDSLAAIQTQGVLGDKYIEISAGSPTSPPRAAGTVLPQVDPVNYEAVLGRSGDIVTNVVELTASLRAILQAIDRGEGLIGAVVRNRERGELTFEQIQATITNLAAVTAHAERILAAVEDGEGLLGVLLRDTTRAEAIVARLARATDNFERFTERLNSSAGLLPRLIEDPVLGDRVLANMDATTTDLAEITGKIRRGEGSLGALINDPRLYDETTALVRGTRTSWTYRMYRGVRGLWPSGGENAPDDPTAPPAVPDAAPGADAGGTAPPDS